jgi:hypothetical protein
MGTFDALQMPERIRTPSVTAKTELSCPLAGEIGTVTLGAESSCWRTFGGSISKGYRITLWKPFSAEPSGRMVLKALRERRPYFLIGEALDLDSAIRLRSSPP